MINYTTKEIKDYTYSEEFTLEGDEIDCLHIDNAAKENHVLSDAAYAARKEDISQNGQETPIICVTGPKGELYILDGRHRTQIARELGIPLRVQVIEDNLSIRQKIAYVIRTESVHRQEPESHRAILAARRVISSDAEREAIEKMPDLSRRRKDELKREARYTSVEAAKDAQTTDKKIRLAKSIIIRGGRLYELLILDNGYSLSRVDKMITATRKENELKTGELKPEYEMAMDGRDEDFRRAYYKIIEESNHKIPADMATRFVLDYIRFEAQEQNYRVIVDRNAELSAEVSVLRDFVENVSDIK